ncbi:alpha-(1-2)-phosphatidylinositol mannosyltransferase [Streptomyces canus]|uniref:Alpha-(1-2)-phosphatidylinositol mannosyltransferase n=1 Tax=Streptomyces canus TaxID=58343 RepID=A0A101RMW4_9ACTN|nr:MULTISPECIES: glycosyltransferase family 4 protein [Streptomyces]KUN58459.1 alpha-(1-2)-phosphatidylinositol mannosyltransferase [Streptomyces canus]MDI5912165.1 glycosyltransferase family 4 protein [Streptomyces sp. 12257]
MGSTLVITNDFPPRQGGIETFVHALAARVPDDDVVVYTSREPGDTAFDATLPFPVIRDSSRTLLPTGRVTARAIQIAEAHGCDRVWFGAAAPLALMAPALRRSGIRQIVATTHGHEIWWAKTPGARRVMRRIGDGVDVVTYLGQYTRSRIEPALGTRVRMSRLVPGVDTDVYRPDREDGPGITDRFGLHGKRVILCVARLVRRKGQDMLIRALPLVQRAVPEAVLVLVGQGPDEARLRKLAQRHARGSVCFAGGTSHAATPPYYAAADVFAMPCRTRKGGLEAEGLGIVFLEASASGLPVVVGDSGGAPDAVLDGATGRVVDGKDPAAIARALTTTLLDPKRAEMGAEGRRWVQEAWSWDASERHLRELLSGEHVRQERQVD